MFWELSGYGDLEAPVTRDGEQWEWNSFLDAPWMLSRVQWLLVLSELREREVESYLATLDDGRGRDRRLKIESDCLEPKET